jgi:drug/metabolite transporter (DMT)-like permease
MTVHARDYLKLHFIVFLWGFAAILGKLVLISSIEMILFRSVLAAAGMGIVIYFSRDNLKISEADFIRLILIGFIVAIHWLSFFGSARVANVSVSLVGFATNSLWTAVLEPIFNKTRIKKFELLLGLIVLLGLYIIFSFDFQYKLGLALAVTAGFTSALFSVFNSRMVKKMAPRTITFYEMCGVFVGTGLFMLAGAMLYDEPARFQWPSFSDWIYIALLAGVCSVYAYTTSVELMKRISVFVIQLTLNLEPLYGIAAAVVIFGEKEKMSANFYLGTLLILCAVFSYPLLKKRFDKPVMID